MSEATVIVERSATAEDRRPKALRSIEWLGFDFDKEAIDFR